MKLLYVCSGEHPLLVTTPEECKGLIQTLAIAIRGYAESIGEPSFMGPPTAEAITEELEGVGFWADSHEHGIFTLVNLAHPQIAKVLA